MTGKTVGSGFSRNDDLHLVKRRTVICSDYTKLNQDNERLPSLEDLKEAAESEVEALVKSLIKNQTPGSKWADPEFGPSVNDELGAYSLYRKGTCSVAGYVKPSQVVWSRPGYSNEPEEGCYCSNARLFRNYNVSRSDIIQGKIGDGWLLSAIAIAATQPSLVKKCFWRLDDFKQYGIYVCRFLKNTCWYYVVIDDRIPVFDCENGQPVFGRCKTNNELWLPLLEKAYAKLHFSYDALENGEITDALRNLTGLCSERIMIAQEENRSSDTVFRRCRELLDYNAAIGCVISDEELYQRIHSKQQKKTSLLQISDGETAYLTASFRRGLEKRHCYGIYRILCIAGTQVVLLRNPWGTFGLWTGSWSATSQEFANHQNDINGLFPEINSSNGFFLMCWNDFFECFTSLIATINYQADGFARWIENRIIPGEWSTHSSGGGPGKATWFTNPVYRFKVFESVTRIFVQLFIFNNELDCGRSTGSSFPVSFSLCKVENGNVIVPDNKFSIPGSNPAVMQQEYSFQSSVSMDVFLSKGTYAIVPHTYDRNKEGLFALFALADKSVEFENGMPINKVKDQFGFQSMGVDEFLPQENTSLLAVTSSRKQAEEVELVKEKLVGISSRKGISSKRISMSFQGNESIGRFDFKDRMMNLGFSVTDIPDRDFEILAFPNSELSCEKLREIFEQDVRRRVLMETKPDSSINDILFKPTAPSSGTLTVNTVEAKNLILSNEGVIIQQHTSSKPVKIIATGKDTFRVKNGDLGLLQVWRKVQNTESPCIPIFFNCADGLSYGIEKGPMVTVTDDLLHNQGYWEEKMKIWASELSNGNLVLNTECISMRGLIPKRLEYINSLIPPSESLFLTRTNSTLESPEEKKVEKVSEYKKLIRVLDVVQMNHHSVASQEMDRIRNEEFFKLKRQRKDKRRLMAQKICKGGGKEATGLTDDERLAFTSVPIVSQYKEADKENTNPKAPIVYDEFKQVYLSDIFGKAVEIVHIHGITPRYPNRFLGEEDDPELVKMELKMEASMFSMVTPIAGEAIVRKVELARSMDLEGWFKTFDTDNNGTIDKIEFRHALDSIGFRLNDPEFISLIDHLDKDGDGTVDYNEFAAFARGETEKMESGESIMGLDVILNAIAEGARGSTPEELNVVWALGSNWYKLREFCSQLRLLTSKCKNESDRHIFHESNFQAPPRAYRISHMFQSPERFKEFLTRAQYSPAESVVEPPTEARDLLIALLVSMQNNMQIDIDIVVKSLPQMLLSNGETSLEPKVGPIGRALLRAAAKKAVADSIAEDPLRLSGSTEETLLQQELENMEICDTVKNGVIQLSVGEQMRFLISDACVTCKTTNVSRSTLGHMINPGAVQEISKKLRLILEAQQRAREGPIMHLVDFFDCSPVATTDRVALIKRCFQAARTNGIIKKEDMEELMRCPIEGVRIVARDTVSNRCFEIHDVVISKTQDLRNYLYDLSKRLVFQKSQSSEGDRLDLCVVECPHVVQFVREILDSCSDLPFFHRVTNTSIHFLINSQREGESTKQALSQIYKTHVLEALRQQQGNRIATSLSGISSALTVVIEESQGDFKEEISWSDFVAHLAERRNIFVKVEVIPSGDIYDTPLSRDGGFNPVFESSVKVPFTPPTVKQQGFLQTRASKICGRYMIAFVRSSEDPSSKRLSVCAFDPKTNDEFLLVCVDAALKETISRRPNTKNRIWGSPKRSKEAQSPSNQLDDKNRSEWVTTSEQVVLEIAGSKAYQDNEKDGISLDEHFPLQDNDAWGQLLKLVKLGRCLTPQVRFTLLNQMGDLDNPLDIGNASFPISFILNHPGRVIDKVITVRNNLRKAVGELRVTFRFDDTYSDLPTVEDLEDAFASTTGGDESVPIDYSSLGKTPSTEKDYSVIAMRLREEVNDIKSKLAESESAKYKLEQSFRLQEDKMREAKSDLVLQQRRLEIAQEETYSNEPKPPKRNAKPEDHETHSHMLKEHNIKLAELEKMRSENHRMRMLADARDAQNRDNINSLKKQLTETEIKLRMEIVEKEQLLGQVDKVNLKTQQQTMEKVETLNQVAGVKNTRILSAKQQKQLEAKRERRSKWLRDRLGSREYKLYQAELETALQTIQEQICSRRPEKPELPLRSMEHLLIADAKISGKELCITGELFEQVLVSFGIVLKTSDMEMIVTHFDTGGDNNVNLDDFIQTLQKYVSSNTMEDHIAAAGFRGVKSVQQSKKNKIKY